MKDWIKTVSGLAIDPLEPTPDKILLGDIVHALSHQCRFAGHTTSFYSVAQHSVLVSEILEEKFPYDYLLQMAGLLHDASEAYLTDMPTPIKKRMPAYKAAEDHLQTMIMGKFLPAYFERAQEIDPLVKKADLTMLRTEARDLHGDPQDWAVFVNVVPHPKRVRSWQPFLARDAFWRRYNALKLRLL